MRRFTLIAALTLALTVCGEAFAQSEDAPKVEVGAQFTSLSITHPQIGGTENLIGFGGRLTYNLTDYFAVEAETNLIADKSTIRSLTIGGRAIQGQFGVKVGKRFDRFGIFAPVPAS